MKYSICIFINSGCARRCLYKYDITQTKIHVVSPILVVPCFCERVHKNIIIEIFGMLFITLALID